MHNTDMQVSGRLPLSAWLRSSVCLVAFLCHCHGVPVAVRGDLALLCVAAFLHGRRPVCVVVYL